MASEGEVTSASRYKWVVLFAALLSCDTYYFAFQSLPPLINEIQSVFAIDHATAGLLMSIVVVPGVIMALPTGMIVSKYGFRRIGFLALLSVALGSLITALSTTFLWALFGRFIMGFGSCFITIGTASIIPLWFQKKEFGLAMGIYSIGVPISTIAAFTISPILGQIFGWRSPFFVGAIAGVMVAVFFGLVFKDVPLRHEEKRTDLSTTWKTLKSKEVWKIGLMWMLFSIVSSGFVTWAPSLLSTFKGISVVYASVLSSMYMVSKIFFIPFYGWASDRLGKRKTIVIAGLFATALSICVLSFLEGTGLTIGILVVGASAGAIPALTFALMAQAVPPRQTGIGFGMMSFSNRIATIIAAPLIGFIIQTTQSMTLTLMFIASFALMSLAVTLTSRAT
ncbi:MAG: MFS transporter [Candidatus Bathyarchaeota archaeon]|nr:MFS transporter [Candidatus Bathyarchaeota archaeon]